jgi:hypothetical protein
MYHDITSNLIYRTPCSMSHLGFLVILGPRVGCEIRARAYDWHCQLGCSDGDGNGDR